MVRQSSHHSSTVVDEFGRNILQSANHHHRSHREERNRQHWDDVSKNDLEGEWAPAVHLQSVGSFYFPFFIL